MLAITLLGWGGEAPFSLDCVVVGLGWARGEAVCLCDKKIGIATTKIRQGSYYARQLSGSGEIGEVYLRTHHRYKNSVTC